MYKRISASSDNYTKIVKVKSINDIDDINRSEEMYKMLIKGEIFTKYGKHGEPHLKVISVTPDLSKVMWRVPTACQILTPIKQIEVIDVSLYKINFIT